MFDRLDDILIRFEELLHELGDPVLASDPEKFRRLMKEQAELAPLVETYTQYKKTKITPLFYYSIHIFSSTDAA